MLTGDPHPLYRTVVADPPWHYTGTSGVNRGRNAGSRKPFLPYPTMSLDEIAELPVSDLVENDAHLFLWTTQRYLIPAFDVVRAWGFQHSATLTWCKEPIGVGPGGLFSVTTEFVLYGRRGKPERLSRVPTTWWLWPRGEHSVKPEAFLDMVEGAVPGPYLEMFSRRARMGWDTWGNESLGHVEMCSCPVGTYEHPAQTSHRSYCALGDIA